MSRRPPNRKALIKHASRELFLSRGYHNVSVADIAEALDIAPSALYYHYRNKQELLYQAVVDTLTSVDRALERIDTLDEAVSALADMVSPPERTFANWEREARHLEGDYRDQIRALEAGLVERLIPLLRTARPELSEQDARLVGRALFGALGSRTQHRLKLPAKRDKALMNTMARVIVMAPVTHPMPAEANGEATSAPGLRGLRQTRRDLLLTQSERLFDERGYASVTMADIGEAAGIVASGVYRHFPGKTDILVAAAQRGGDRLRASIASAASAGPDPLAVLTSLVRGHVDVVREHQHLLGILAHESEELPDAERRTLRRFEHDYLDLWVDAVAAARGDGTDTMELKLLILAAQSMSIFVVRRSPETAGQALGDELVDLSLRVLLDT